MTKEKLQHYIQMVNDKNINTDLLISCLANLEPRISKAAYFRAKFKNSGMISNDCYEYDMKRFMKYRTQLTNILTNTYCKQNIKVLVSSIDKNEMANSKLCDSVVQLIEDGDFHLI